MTRFAWLALVLAACSFDRSGVSDDAGVGEIDADPTAPDADPNAPDADPTAPDASDDCISWPAVNVSPCDAALPGPGDDATTISGGRYRYDTTTGLLTAPGGATTTPPSAVRPQGNGGPDVRVLVVAGLVIEDDGALSVTGTHPLIIVVHGDVKLSGTIDGSAARDELTRAGIPGPGAGGSTCANAATVDGEPSTGTGGGGGGGGAGSGEDGGDGGDGNGMGHGGKGSKGPKNGADTQEPLRGGCGGGDGGDDDDGLLDGGGAGGDGGGAIEITARGTISVEGGSIRASGTGGLAAQLVRAGGGGGGTGGAILLDGEVLSITAASALCANGGGGGEGGQLNAVTAAQDGANPTCDANRAPGGGTQPEGGDGGDGGAGAGNERKGTNASNGAAEAGGGGGGGSAGRIRLRARAQSDIDAGAIISPTATN